MARVMSWTGDFGSWVSVSKFRWTYVYEWLLNETLGFSKSNLYCIFNGNEHLQTKMRYIRSLLSFHPLFK